MISQTLNLVFENNLEMTFSLITHHVPGKWQHCQADRNRKTENSLGRWKQKKNICLHTGEDGQSPARSRSNTDVNRPFLQWSRSQQWVKTPPITPSRHAEGTSSGIFPYKAKPSSGWTSHLSLLTFWAALSVAWLITGAGRFPRHDTD